MLYLYNTLTRKLELFEPRKKLEVKMYTCGPSTYERAHIGNFRTFLFEDILQRYLEYLGYKVTRLITLTDVEDKAISRAEQENLSLEELTRRNEEMFFRDCELLKIRVPDYAVRASTVVDQAVFLIKALVKKGLAYWHRHGGSENVYFDPLKFEGFGKLARLDTSRWSGKKRRFHKDTYPGSPWNKGDFILWHGCKKDNNSCWETEIGAGRPAWNIQDASIVTKHLGFAIDVACGGIDNLVRHHDYTIAIAEGASDCIFSRYWLHGEHLFVNSKKMSKSRGSVYYIADLLTKGFQSEDLRFFLIYGHYREKLNFTWKQLAEVSRKIRALRSMLQELENAASSISSENASAIVATIIPNFERHMNDDLDVKAAFDTLYHTVVTLHTLMKKRKLSNEDAKTAISGLRRIDGVLEVIF